MFEPLVSIIIPIYNVEKYVCEAVDSALKQRYQKTEIILSDDGSPDRCPAMCDEYAIADDRVIVIHKTNGGLSDSRNYGLDIADGEYISNLDSDDLYHPDMVLVLLEEAQKNNADIVICNIDEVDDDGNVIEGSSYPKVENGIYNREDALYLLSSKAENTCSVAWNKMYHRKVWENCRYPYGKIHEDVFVIHHLIGHSSIVTTLNQSLYIHRIRPGSIMTTRNAYSYACAIEAFCDKLEFFLDNGYVETIDKIDKECFEVIKSAYWIGYYDDSIVAKAIHKYRTVFAGKVLLKGYEKIRRCVFWKCPLLERVMTIIYRNFNSRGE